MGIQKNIQIKRNKPPETSKILSKTFLFEPQLKRHPLLLSLDIHEGHIDISTRLPLKCHLRLSWTLHGAEVVGVWVG